MSTTSDGGFLGGGLLGDFSALTGSVISIVCCFGALDVRKYFNKLGASPALSINRNENK